MQQLHIHARDHFFNLGILHNTKIAVKNFVLLFLLHGWVNFSTIGNYNYILCNLLDCRDETVALLLEFMI